MICDGEWYVSLTPFKIWESHKCFHFTKIGAVLALLVGFYIWLRENSNDPPLANRVLSLFNSRDVTSAKIDNLICIHDIHRGSRYALLILSRMLEYFFFKFHWCTWKNRKINAARITFQDFQTLSSTACFNVSTILLWFHKLKNMN